MIETALLAIAMAQPIHRNDVGEPDRLSRISWVVEAIGVTAGGNRLMAAALLRINIEESALRADVQEGRCPPHECDELRARSGYQLHRAPMTPHDVWMGYAGTSYPNVLSATVAASRLLHAGMAKCGSLEGAMAYYATGGRCYWSGAASRAAEARRLAGRL